MKKTTLFLTVLLLLILSVKTSAQISFKTEYFGKSEFRDNDNNKVGDGKGSAFVYQGNIRIPLSVKTSEESSPVIWGVDLSGAYASLDNKNLSNDYALSRIANAQFSLFNIRPLNQSWSLISFAGAGLYTDQTKVSKLNARSILANAGAIFVKKINSNFDLGGGVVLNNAFGYPMVFPALYLNYFSEDNYIFKVSMLNGFQASAGYNLNKTFTINLIAEMNGQMALIERNGKDGIFTHQYLVAGLRPEIKINKNITLPLTAGINGIRSAYFNDRTLKSVFDGKQGDAHFKFSPYFAAEINYKF